MKKILVIVLALVLLLPVIASIQPAQPAAGEVLESDKERITSPNVTQSEQALLVEGNSAFAFELYRALKGKGDNIFYSPYSISLALAMTYAGANGETAQQMADTLQFMLEQERLHPAFNWLDAELAKRGQGAQGKDGKGFRLNIANAIWGQKDYEFLPAFLDVLAENYGAGLRILDFITETEKSRVAINDWVSDQTEGRIKDLIPPGAIDALTRLVLTNAIYFNAAWENPFDKKMTADGQFYLLDGGQVRVPMMKQTESFGYTEGEGYQAVELLYDRGELSDGGELSMVILLPASGNFEAFEEGLQAQQVDAIIDDLQNTQVTLAMPQFEFDSKFSLKDTLAGMGMRDAFSPSDADFSGMTGNPELFISDVVHKAFVAVDEAGTEAAAATAVIVGTTSAPGEPLVEVTIDRPFIFLIRDIETGAILFVGRVLNPGATKGEGFAIYLTKEDIPPAQMEALSHVDIADQPVISMKDVVTYNAQTNEIKLTTDAFERVSQLDVPVEGKSFLVCVDKGPIYWGAFWTPISSISFDGVTIWKPLGTQESKVITLELGYPSSSFYGGEDPRNNAEVIKSLEQAGKLVNKLSITEVDKLPRSLKGYELYSWEEDNQWHFTLITGTNRAKTMEEITSKEDFISETGWVKIQVVGAHAIKDVLSRLPQSESIFWCDELHIGQTTGTDIDIQLPPEQIIEVIKEHAERCGLDLVVTVH
jgi:serpin B